MSENQLAHFFLAEGTREAAETALKAAAMDWIDPFAPVKSIWCRELAGEIQRRNLSAVYICKRIGLPLTNLEDLAIRGEGLPAWTADVVRSLIDPALTQEDLRIILRNQHWTQQDLAARWGITRTWLSKKLAGSCHAERIWQDAVAGLPNHDGENVSQLGQSGSEPMRTYAARKGWSCNLLSTRWGMSKSFVFSLLSRSLDGSPQRIKDAFCGLPLRAHGCEHLLPKRGKKRGAVSL